MKVVTNALAPTEDCPFSSHRLQHESLGKRILTPNVYVKLSHERLAQIISSVAYMTFTS